MAKHITVDHKGKSYELMYTRESVARLEQAGFDVEKIRSMPVTMIPLLVYGAFWAKHPRVTARQSEDILLEIQDKSGFYEALVGLYSLPVMALSEDDEGKEGNAKWGLSD